MLNTSLSKKEVFLATVDGMVSTVSILVIVKAVKFNASVNTLIMSLISLTPTVSFKEIDNVLSSI